MAITILEGSNFCISDQNGDFTFATSGLYAYDTRFLSRLELTINGERPLLLSAGKAEYYSAAYFLRNPLAGELAQDTVSIGRHRFVGEGMQDHLRVQNQSQEKISFELALEFENDFADIFAVKNYDFALGDPLRAIPLPPPAEARYEEDENQFVLDDDSGLACTQVILSERGHVEPGKIRYWIELEPRQTWELGFDVVPVLGGDPVRPHMARQRFGEERERVEASLTAWNLRVPRLRATWDELDHAFPRSVADLASLRLSGGNGLGNLPAAGMPWFMTVFGRDTLITCLQTLLFGPELARSALEVLAELQATEDDPSIDAEPGKIVHEVRRGKAAKNWFERYYGTLDATPLYLILLAGPTTTLWYVTSRIRRCALLPGSRSTATGTATASSSTPSEARPGSTISPGRTRGTRSCSRTGRSPSPRSRRWRSRGTSTTRRSASPSSRARFGASGSSPSGSTGRRTTSALDSTRRSGPMRVAGSTCSRSTATRSRSTRSAPTSGTCCGAASSHPAASTRSSTG
jgi:hypothetical protein